MANYHEVLETHIGAMVVLVLAVISIGGIVTIMPLFWQVSLTTPVSGLKR